MMRALPDDWTLPALTPFNHEWFTSGTIAIQRCTKCGTLQHPPDEICHVCGAMDFDTTTMSPTGTVASYTVVHYAAHRALAEAVPYTLVAVSLDDVPHLRVIGNLDTPAGTEARVGTPVEAYWVERTTSDGTRILLPQWRTTSR